MAHDFCGGKKKQGEGTCTRPSGWGTSHAGSGKCKLHGGSTPSGMKSAQREVATKLARTLGEPVEGEPEEFLMVQLAWRQGQVEWWRSRVHELDPDAVIHGTRGVSRTVIDQSGGEGGGFQQESTTTDVGPLLHLALQEYKAAQTALEWLSLQLVKTELGRRMVKLAEDQQAMLADGLRWLVSEARLRLDLNDAEGSCLMDLVGEMMARLDRIEAGAKV